MQVGKWEWPLCYRSWVEVLSPEWLRREIAEEMRRVAEVYGSA